MTGLDLLGADSTDDSDPASGKPAKKAGWFSGFSFWSFALGGVLATIEERYRHRRR